MAFTLLKSRRVQIWASIMLGASLCFAWAISEQIRHRKAGRAAVSLHELVSHDSRFARVQIHRSTNARVWLDGEVASAEDLSALQQLIKQTNVPPGIGVFVSVRLPNNQRSL
jgi:hypothetical protein